MQMPPEPLQSDQLQLVSCPHPLTFAQRRMVLHEGGTLREMIAASSEEIHDAHVFVDDVLIPEIDWDSVRPRGGSLVTVRVIPHGGGGGKNLLRIVLSIAIAVLAYYTGGLAAKLYGPLWGAAVTVGVSMVGSMALNALIPPPTPKVGATDGLSIERGAAITGTRNRLVPFGAVPVVFGTHRLYPPLAALPYTETLGDQQFYRMLFAVGHAPLTLSNFKIGETAIAGLAGVTIEEGVSVSSPPTLFSSDVTETSLSIKFDSYIRSLRSVVFLRSATVPATPTGGTYASPRPTSSPLWQSDFPEGEDPLYWSERHFTQDAAPPQDAAWSTPKAWVVGDDTTSALVFDHSLIPWATRATAVATDEISIDFGALRGLTYFDAKGRRLTCSVDVQMESSPAGAGTWTAVTPDEVTGPGSHVGAGVVRLQSNENKPQVVGVRWAVANGQYDVRMKRVAVVVRVNDPAPPSDVDAPNFIDDLHWTALRSIAHVQPVALPGIKLVALRIQATDQLQGIVEEFNCIASATLPIYNGSAWTTGPSNSPAWAYAHVLTGSANLRALPLARLDAAGLKAWADDCATRGFEFNAVIDAKTTAQELLRNIAAVGRAAPTLIDGKHGVVRDVAQSTPVQMFSPRNSWGFRGSKVFLDQPHALKAKFVRAENGYQADEITVYDDGYNAGTATKFETLELFGVTAAAHAWKLGRYHIAVGRLRPELFELSCDIEHLVCTRGDLVRVAHDVPLWGSSWARIKTIDGLVITLDESVTMALGTSYAVRVRTADGTITERGVTTVAGETETLTLASAVTGLAAGDLLLFGTLNLESTELIIKSIEPGQDLTARLIMVDAAPAVLTADSGTIPAYDPRITLPDDPSLWAPPVPVVTSVTASLLPIAPAYQMLDAQLQVAYSLPSGGKISAVWIQSQYRVAGTTAWMQGPEVLADALLVNIPALAIDTSYDLRIRALSAYRTPSAWVSSTGTVDDDDMETYVGTLDALTIETVALNYNARNDRNTTALVAPVIASDGTALDYTLNDDGTANVSFEWSWAGTNEDIDGFVIFVHPATTDSAYTWGSLQAEEYMYRTPANVRAFLFNGVPANLYYWIAILAYRNVDDDIAALVKLTRPTEVAVNEMISAWVEPTFAGTAPDYLDKEFPYRPADEPVFHGDIAGTINGNIPAANVNVWTHVSGANKPADNATVGAPNGTYVGGQLAEVIAGVGLNFNTRNDRIATAISAPTFAINGTAMEHTLNDDGSCNIRVQWLWGGTLTDIDGFRLYGRGSTSASAYTMGTTPAEEYVIDVPASKMVAGVGTYTFQGLAANLYYTLGVQAFRLVDPDVNANGFIVSSIGQPTIAGENPYRPSASVSIAGTVTVGSTPAANINDWPSIGGTGKPADNATDTTNLHGNGPPAGALGKIGYSYLDDLTNCIYLKTGASTWVGGASFYDVVIYGDLVVGNYTSGITVDVLRSTKALRCFSGSTQTVTIQGDGLALAYFLGHEVTAIGIYATGADYEAVFGTSNQYGIKGQTTGSGYAGVYGIGGASVGVYGTSTSAQGGYFVSTNSVGVHGVGGGTSGTARVGGYFDGYASGYDVYLASSAAYAFTGAHEGIVDDDFTAEPGDILVDIGTAFKSSVFSTLCEQELSSTAKQRSACGVYTGMDKINSVNFPTTGSLISAIQTTKTWEELKLLIQQPGVPSSMHFKEIIAPSPNEFQAIKLQLVQVMLHKSVCRINALGEGQINVCKNGGNIAIGDYICTSNRPGKGMKQDDDLLHNYTVAKAREAVSWSAGDDSIKTIACSYHAC